MAFRGIPWTQAWSDMYIASFCIIEVLMFIGSRRPATDLTIVSKQQNILPDEHENDDDFVDSPVVASTSRPIPDRYNHLPIVDESWFTLALLLQNALFSWAFYWLCHPVLASLKTFLSGIRWESLGVFLYIGICFFTTTFVLLHLLLSAINALVLSTDSGIFMVARIYISILLTSLIAWPCILLLTNTPIIGIRFSWLEDI
jgi:hypothetical protein